MGTQGLCVERSPNAFQGWHEPREQFALKISKLLSDNQLSGFEPGNGLYFPILGSNTSPVLTSGSPEGVLVASVNV